MSQNINILFLGGAKRISLAERFISAGEKLGKKIKIFSYELDQYVPIRCIASIIIGCKFNDPAIYSDLVQTINKYNINIMLPLVDPAISVCANLKNQLTNVFIPVSNYDICDIMYDKILANKWFISYGFPVPCSSVFPMIAKPRFGSASKGIRILNNKLELNHFISDHYDYLIQSFIDAFEYTVDSYITCNHLITGIVPRQRLEVIGGEVSKSITVYNKRLIQLSRELIEKGGFEGPINIQYLISKNDEEIYIMEVNPRFGGGVINSIEAGFDIPSILLSEYIGKEVQVIDEIKFNLMMLRANREVFICK